MRQPGFVANAREGSARRAGSKYPLVLMSSTSQATVPGHSALWLAIQAHLTKVL